MRRVAILISSCALMGGAVTAVGVTPALAKNCPASSLKAAVTCFNNRIAAQHKQIVKLQNQVKALSKSQTVAGLSSRLSAVESTVSNQGSQLTNVVNRTDCWGNGVNVSEFTTGGNPWGSSSAAGGFPYPSTSAWSYLDIFHQSEPSDQNVLRLITYQC